MHKYFTKSLQSFVAFPVLAANLAFAPLAGVLTGSPTAAVIFSDTNRPLTSKTADNQQKDLTTKAEKVDAYFAQYDLPLAGHGETLVRVAEENNLPWTVLAAIAMRESTGGKFACKKDRENAFGYNSCKHVDFESFDQAIEIVAHTIAGKREKTAHFYEGKELADILDTYNGRAVPHYSEEVMWIMSQIEKQEPIAAINDSNA